MNNLLPNDILLNDLHLTNEQLDDILLGDAPHAVVTHYESCAECGAKGTAMMSAIQSFTAVTMEWSERRSATLPAQPVTDGSPWSHKMNWALGVAVVVVGVILLPLVTRSTPGGTKAVANQAQASTPQQDGPSAATQVAASASPAAPLPAVRTAQPSQVARDNRMLQAIDEELDASVASPAETFGIEAPQGGGRAGQHDLPSAIWD